MAVISIRLNEREEEVFKAYADITGKTISDVFKSALIEKIEDEMDYAVIMNEKVQEEHLYTLEEAAKLLGVSK